MTIFSESFLKPVLIRYSTFDLVIHLNESIDSETSELLVDHLLEQATVSLKEKNHKEKLSTLAFDEFKQVCMGKHDITKLKQMTRY